MDYVFSFLLGLITYAIHVLFKYNEAVARNKKGRRKRRMPFVWYLEKNITRLIVSLLAYIAVYILLARIGTMSITIGSVIIGKAGFLYMFSFLAGYSSDSLFRNLIKVINKSWEGKIGVSDVKK